MKPLEQLNAMHLPTPPSWWPLAPGWWLLMAIAVLSLAVASWVLRQYRKNNHYRKHALLALNALSNKPILLVDILQVLRRTLKTVNPKHPWLSLANGPLLVEINQFSRKQNPALSQEALMQLGNSAYMAEPAPLTCEQQQQLLASARYWIKQHRRHQPC